MIEDTAAIAALRALALAAARCQRLGLVHSAYRHGDRATLHLQLPRPVSLAAPLPEKEADNA